MKLFVCLLISLNNTWLFPSPKHKISVLHSISLAVDNPYSLQLLLYCTIPSLAKIPILLTLGFFFTYILKNQLIHVYGISAYVFTFYNWNSLYSGSFLENNIKISLSLLFLLIAFASCRHAAIQAHSSFKHWIDLNRNEYGFLFSRDSFPISF